MKLAAVAVCVACLCAQALSIVTFAAPTEYKIVGPGHCWDSSGKHYDSFENYEGNGAKICEDSVEQCKEACSMFEYGQCRGFNYYTDYGGAANTCDGKGRCELRMEVGFTDAKEGWKIVYRGGRGSGPIKRSDGNAQGTDCKCYQRQPPPPPTTTTPPSVTAAPSPQSGSCEGQPRFDVMVCNSFMCTDCILAWCTEACHETQLRFPGCRCDSWPEARKSFSGGEFAGKGKFGDVGDYSAGTGITPVS